MPVISDSYMGIFLPRDIADRITRFMASKVDFPFIQRDETIGSFYLFGKDHGVSEQEVKAAADLARSTVEQVARDIRLYQSTPQKMDSRFTRENYTKRSLQIVVDSGADREIDRRVAGDPAILSDCFAQHVAYYRQGYFFELFKPFAPERLPGALQGKLKGRMLLLGFNAKDRQSLSLKSPLDPFFAWMSLKV